MPISNLSKMIKEEHVQKQVQQKSDSEAEYDEADRQKVLTSQLSTIPKDDDDDNDDTTGDDSDPNFRDKDKEAGAVLDPDSVMTLSEADFKAYVKTMQGKNLTQSQKLVFKKVVDLKSKQLYGNKGMNI
jgi:hypothetical protein